MNLGLINPSPLAIAKLPRLDGKVDKAVVPYVPAYWMDLDPQHFRYPTDDNDVDGDCVVAEILHYIESQWRRRYFQAYVKGMPTDKIGTADEANTWYWAEVARQGGGTDQTPPGPGLDPIQAHLDWATYGITVAGELLKAVATFTVSLTDMPLFKWAAYNFAGLALSVCLPDDYPQLARQTTPWAPTTAPDEQNGHQILVCGFEQGLYQIASWGNLYMVEPAWIREYAQLAIVSFTEDWTTIAGMDTQAVEAELEALGGQVATPQTQD